MDAAKTERDLIRDVQKRLVPEEDLEDREKPRRPRHYDEVSRFLLARLDDQMERAKQIFAFSSPDMASTVFDVFVKRRLIDSCETAQYLSDHAAAPPDQGGDRVHGTAMGYEGAVAWLAAAYANHPDYNDDWQP